jgi:segregation and condensation protein B
MHQEGQETERKVVLENSEDELHLKRVVEALIFASDEPLSLQQIRLVLHDHSSGAREFERVTVDLLKDVVDGLNREYEASKHAYRIIEIAGGVQFATLPMHARWIGRLFRERARRRMTQAALETLSIIAYRQPVSTPEIEYIRGVNVDGVVRSLLEKELITIVGRGEGVGRPLLYGTTQKFLKHFGLRGLADLPKPREIAEIMKELGGPGTAETSMELSLEGPWEQSDSDTPSLAIELETNESLPVEGDVKTDNGPLRIDSPTE